MRLRNLLYVLALMAGCNLFAADNYEPGPDSKPQPDVPKGDITRHVFDQSKVFPGTTRDYWVYVPKQYDGKPSGWPMSPSAVQSWTRCT